MAMMTVMSFFLMNLFVGVIVDNFSRHKQEHGGESVTLTKTQQRWVAKVGKKYAKILKKVKSAKAKAKETSIVKGAKDVNGVVSIRAGMKGGQRGAARFATKAKVAVGKGRQAVGSAAGRVKEKGKTAAKAAKNRAVQVRTASKRYCPSCCDSASSSGHGRADDFDWSSRAMLFAVTSPEGRWYRVFEAIINCLVIANAGVTASYHFGQTVAATQAVATAGGVVVVIFTIETVVRILGLGPSAYFQENWHRFDFVISVLSVANLLVIMCSSGGSASAIGAGSFVSLSQMPLAPGAPAILRILRLGGVSNYNAADFRFSLSSSSASVSFGYQPCEPVSRAFFDFLSHLFCELHRLITTIVLMLPSLLNVVSLMLLIFFIFSVFGVQLFATVQFGENLNAQANFRTFGNAMLTLVRCSTGEFWNGLMHDAAATPSGCVSYGEVGYDKRICVYAHGGGAEDGSNGQANVCSRGELALLGLVNLTATREEYLSAADAHGCCAALDGCGNTGLACTYFVAFTLVVYFVALDLFVAVVLDRFEEQREEVTQRESMTPTHPPAFRGATTSRLQGQRTSVGEKISDV
jgi:hypothetical protein